VSSSPEKNQMDCKIEAPRAGEMHHHATFDMRISVMKQPTTMGAAGLQRRTRGHRI
jgi:hypothetical protein